MLVLSSFSEYIMRNLLLAPVLLASLVGCATYDNGAYYEDQARSGYDRPAAYSGYNHTAMQGTVIDVQNIATDRQRTSGVGAVLGAVIGGAVGNQIGDGDGQTLATIGGAVAGGVIGNNIERNNNGGEYGWGQRVRVRLDNGEVVEIVQSGTSLYAGARVLISGYGRGARAMLR